MQTSTWKAVLLLLLAAALGGAVGSVATATMGRHAHRSDDPHGRGSDRYIGLLRRELDLTREQQDSIRAILRAHRREMDALWATLGPPMDRMRDSIRADVRAMLTEAQQGRFDSLTARLDARRRERMHRDSTER